MSDNAKEEDPPKENEGFDYSSAPKRFYFEVETVGSVSPQEVVLKVRACSDRSTVHPLKPGLLPYAGTS